MILAFIFCMVMLFGAVQALADDAAPAANTATVECYALVNGEWKLVTVEKTAQQMASGSIMRYYITADELEQIYGEFGFSAASYAGERIFPHTDMNDASLIWADAAPVMVSLSAPTLWLKSSRRLSPCTTICSVINLVSREWVLATQSRCRSFSRILIPRVV